MKIEIPTTCPSCGSVLIWKKDLLYCMSDECGQKDLKKILNFTQVLKIKGLGSSTIQKLNLKTIFDIYSITPEYIQEHLNSEKIAYKIITEIEKSKYVPLSKLLPAFSIPLIGKTVTEKLMPYISHVTDISEEVCREAGLGPKATENLMKWYNEELLEVLRLPFSFKSDFTAKPQVKGTVCITGKLKSFRTKAEAEKVLLNAGYLVKSTLTKDVTYLVNESGVESSKTEMARNRGISIISNLTQLIG